MLKLIKIFTDGSCLGNPGPGGYATLIQYEKYEKIFHAGFYYTTNNRMELMGVISGIEKIKKPCLLHIFTDSRYVHNGITIWINRWKEKKWKNTMNKKIKNLDLWIHLNDLISHHNITWMWIHGHSGHKENEKCDSLARLSASNPYLIDIGYNKLNLEE
ncbi:MAG: ribonuclease HI [Buchnera aphidicola (Eriosoma harunire)]